MLRLFTVIREKKVTVLKSDYHGEEWCLETSREYKELLILLKYNSFIFLYYYLLRYHKALTIISLIFTHIYISFLISYSVIISSSQKSVLPSDINLTYYNHSQIILAKILEIKSVSITITSIAILAGGYLISSLLSFN